MVSRYPKRQIGQQFWGGAILMLLNNIAYLLALTQQLLHHWTILNCFSRQKCLAKLSTIQTIMLCSKEMRSGLETMILNIHSWQIIPKCGQKQNMKKMKVLIGACNICTLVGEESTERPQRRTSLVAKELSHKKH